jgi:hypothetical protein
MRSWRGRDGEEPDEVEQLQLVQLEGGDADGQGPRVNREKPTQTLRLRRERIFGAHAQGGNRDQVLDS